MMKNILGKIILLGKIIKYNRELRPIIKNHIFLHENRGQSLWGSISDIDEQVIINLVSKANLINGPIIEIGSLFGFTTQLIATYKKNDKQLIAIENFTWNPFGISSADHRSITNRILRYVKTHCVTTIFDGSNEEFYDKYHDEKPSMIFIDADHSYEGVKKDIDWAVNKKIPIISGHDYCDLWPGVMQAVDETFGNEINVQGSVWYHIDTSG